MLVDSPRSLLKNIVTYGPFALLMFGVLAFGTVEAWSILILQLGAALLLVLWAVSAIRTQELELSAHPLFAPMLCFGALILLQLLLGHTAYRYATFYELMLYVPYGILCFLVAQNLQRTREFRTIAAAVSGFGFAVALFALLQSFSSHGMLYWLRPMSGWIYGPYINHNHYAGLMEMLSPIPVVLALSHHVHGTARKWAAGAGAFMAATIFLSGSRGGMVACAVQMTLLAIVMVRRGNRKSAWIMGAILLTLVGLLAWLGGGELTQRVATFRRDAHSELSGGVRLSIDRDALRMFTHHPVLGWGAGTFREVYPQFRSFYAAMLIDRAHNDYLQLLDETGLAGFGIMLWFLIAMYRNAFAKLSNWTRDANGTAALAAILGCTGILVHSFVDFNLHIPANAALFYVLCFVAAMPSRFRSYRHQDAGVMQQTFGPVI
jgi:O-antigen ligase